MASRAGPRPSGGPLLHLQTDLVDLASLPTGPIGELQTGPPHHSHFTRRQRPSLCPWRSYLVSEPLRGLGTGFFFGSDVRG